MSVQRQLAYGDGEVLFESGDMTIDKIIELKQQHIKCNTDILEALDNPIDMNGFDSQMIEKQPNKVAILVEDNTRKNPEYPDILDVIITKIENVTDADIYLIIAYGTHRHHTDEENEKLYGKTNLARVTVIHHDSRDKSKLTKVCRDGGEPLLINKWAAEADYLMVIGSVKPHAFAGYTGGRKMILPGIASYDNIRNNHSMVGRDHVQMGVLKTNPIHEDMAKKAAMVQVDFSIQMVKDATGNLAGYFTGDPVKAFEYGTDLSKKLCGIKLTEKADVVIASIGGKPKDNSLYQSTRAITNAVAAVKEDGILFVIGELSSGVGNELLETWLSKPLDELLNLEPERIDIGIHSAYLAAVNYSQCQCIYLFSEQDEKWTKRYHYKYLDRLSDIEAIVASRYDKGARIYLMPNASDIMILDDK